MATANQPQSGTASRTVGIVVVVLLIVVAIAGIVLAGRKGGEPAGAAAPASQPVTAAATPASAAAPAGDPNEVIFEAGSDKLSPSAKASVVRFADAARAGNNVVRVTARYLTGADKQKRFELAKARAAAVHHALSADGVPGGRLQMELSEVPAGVITDKDVDRLQLSLH